MLDDTVAIVTGGSTGIGKAIAEKYLEHGADVVVSNRTEESGRETAEELGCEYVQCDVSEYDQVETLIEATVEEFGRLDTIVNNAGIGHAASLEEMSIEDWQRVLRVNLDGVMYGSRAALPHLKETEGSIVNVASIYGLVAGPGAPAYSAAKGGVVNLTREIAVDYASANVRANCICPGFVETPMTDDYLEQDQFYEFVRGETPLGRVAQPEEISGIAAFLASEEASYITGANIPVDGGWTAH
ncbi:glucose 1-dehydrogenase [Halogeometricum pallidum JCM 14848]|uniref:Glucose 1-dehydrogenase n=1 Tax=Halogeometricum pallidum JCM 14848 TaxID=1227487 RepID=M0CZ54_HALPD|nr:SDR family NAD(P)-dependent oxidoreductase [Halogeometricum pallidum]ELZ28496.1 glucose 1-dehydrogenase [Halogeometricum pallidum JCM 14848]